MELNIFKKEKFEIKNLEFIDESNKINIPQTNLKYNNIDILISANNEESLKHIEKDYKTLSNEGIEKLIKNNFIPWLKGNEFKSLDDQKIYNGLKLTDISYHYHKIIGKYSPTEKDDFFGEFEFDFKSSNEYTKDLLQASAFVILVNDDKIYFGRNYDI